MVRTHILQIDGRVTRGHGLGFFAVVQRADLVADKLRPKIARYCLRVVHHFRINLPLDKSSSSTHDFHNILV